MPHIDATHNVLYTLVFNSSQKLRLITILTRNRLMYAETPLRRPTFDASNIIVPITSFFGRLLHALMESRRKQAAKQAALHLKATSSDFADIAYQDLVAWILDDQHPRHLDGTSFVESSK
jgi:DNA-binding FadR family transcriptional regulator